MGFDEDYNEVLDDERKLNNEEMEKELAYARWCESTKNNQFISDVFDIDEAIRRYGNKIFLIAGVGAGKSTWVKEILTKKGSVLFITSRRVKVDEDVNDSLFENRINVNDVRRHYEILVTNAKMEKALVKWSTEDGVLDGYLDKFDYIVVDEVHSIATDATYADSSFAMRTFIEYVANKGKRIIVMTGTPEPVEKYFHKKNWSTFDLRKRCNYVKPFKISTIRKDRTIKLIKSELEKGNKVVYFVNRTDTIKEYYKELLKKEIVVEDELAAIVASDKHEKMEEDLKEILGERIEHFLGICKKTYDSITHEKRLPDECKILLSTSKLREGVDIMNENVTVICDNHILSNIIQFCGRVRVGDGEVYIIKDSPVHPVNKDDLFYRYACDNEMATANEFLEKYIKREGNAQEIAEREHFIEHVEKNPYVRFNYITKKFEVEFMRYEEELRLIADTKVWEEKLKIYCQEYDILNPYMTLKQRKRMLFGACKNAIEREVKFFAKEDKDSFAKMICDILGTDTYVQQSKVNRVLEKYGYTIKSKKESKGEYRDKTYWYVAKCVPRLDER